MCNTSVASDVKQKTTHTKFNHQNIFTIATRVVFWPTSIQNNNHTTNTV